MMVSAHAYDQAGAGSQGAETADAAVRAAQTGVKAAVEGLQQQNDDIIRSAAYFVAEVEDVQAAHKRAFGSLSAGLSKAFSQAVLDILKGNADQLQQLKQDLVSEKQAAREHAKKMILWMSGSAAAASAAASGAGGAEQQGSSSGGAAGQLSVAADAVKQHGFRPLQMPGSSIAATHAPAAGPGGWQALKFWQVGTQSSKLYTTTGRAAAAAGDTTSGAADQQQQAVPQKSLSSLLFGKHKRWSSGGTAADASRRLSIDPAASWRSSMDGSLNGRRASTRSSDAGAALVAAAAAAAAAAASAGGSAEQHQHQQHGAMMSSLAAGEGPLSKSHSMLATKPGAQQEQILGKSLEIVAEDEREGRDSPVPAEPAARKPSGAAAGQPRGLAPIRVPRGSLHMLAGGNRPGSPVDSFSFGNRPEDEQPQSPNFLRTSVSSRMGQQHAGAVAGPLVRSSTALRASMVARVDPFEAPEPEAQPFVEAMQQQDAAAAAAQGGMLAALRRSISGGGSGGGRAPPGRWEVQEAAGGGGRPPRHLQIQAHEQYQQAPEGGASVQFLDLDATRAYALGVHQVMMRLEQGMQSARSQSEASSRPASPGGSITESALALAAARAGMPAAEEQAAEAASSQETEDEQEEDDDDAVQQQQLLQQHRSAREQAGGSGHGTPSAGRGASAYASSAGMPPLRSGLSSPAASRRQTGLGTTPVARQLPLMGQASMEILERQQQHQQHMQQRQQQQPLGVLHSSRQASLAASSSAALSLADVYKQTSGNLAPLSSHLSGMTRRSSSNANRAQMLQGPTASPPSRAGAATTGSPFAAASRSILGEATGPLAHYAHGGGGSMGPLSMQYGSTMQHAKQSAHAAGLSAGAPAPAGSLPAGWAGGGGGSAEAMGGLDAAGNNKYASSWGIMDAGGMSRQSSMNGGGGAAGAQLSRMPSGSVRASPRLSTADPAAEPAGWHQQQRLRGAAGRYAGPSFTPGSQSPRSGTATPAREDSSAAMMMTMNGAAGSGAYYQQQPGPARRRVVAAAAGGGRGGAEQGSRGAVGARGGAPQGRQAGSTAGSDDYESAEEQLSSGASAMSGLSGPYVSTGGAAGGSSSNNGASNGLPNPPAFLSGRPTSAQAAVATQWSPSKNAAAFAQAPAYMRDAVLTISREPSSGLHVPQGLQVNTTSSNNNNNNNSSRGVSPRDAAGAAGSIGGGRLSQASGQYNEGGGSQATSSYNNIYAPLDPPVKRSASGRQLYQQQPQQQPQVLTAVDLARRQSQIIRASSTGAQQAHEYGGAGAAGGLSSNGRMSSSSMHVGYTQSSFQGGYSNTVGTFPGGGRQQQQQWGGGSTEQAAGIYSTVRPQLQRQQYRF